ARLLLSAARFGVRMMRGDGAPKSAKSLWLVPCGTQAPSGAPTRAHFGALPRFALLERLLGCTWRMLLCGRFRHGALLSSGPSRKRIAPTEPSASSWQGLLVAPEGAPMPPECLVATRPAGAAPRPASRRLMKRP